MINIILIIYVGNNKISETEGEQALPNIYRIKK